MKGLILKDLYIVKNQMKSLLVILLMFCLLSIINQNTSFILFLIPFYMIMILITTFSYDEFNHWEIYCSSLPFSRKQIVKAKYLLFFSFIAFILVLGILIAYIGPHFSTKIVTASILSSLIGSLFGSALFVSLLLPFYYKYGSQKGRIMLFSIIIGVSLIGGILFQLMKSLSFSLSEIIAKINQIPILGTLGILVLIIFVMIYVSYFISCHIYEKKEF